MPERKLNKKCVALGNFDGLHLGHKSVLQKALSFCKKGYEPTVVLFDIHPREYLTGEKTQQLLLKNQAEKELENMGFSLCVIPFSKVCDLTPKEFFDEILIKELNSGAVCCGFNYSFGKNGSGKSDDLIHLCQKAGIEFSVCDEIQINGETVSSTAIKNHLKNGEIEKANKMLSRNYFFESEVIHGDNRGHTLGFPTINQKIPDGLAILKFGVYETTVTVDGKKYKGVTNIGIRPTYLLDTAISETNILNFNSDIYGKTVKIEFLRYLRQEKKFDSVDDLINQMNEDKKRVSDGV